MSVLKAFALIVVVLLTEIGFKYLVEEGVGVVPSVVYVMVAPIVVQDSSTS